MSKPWQPRPRPFETRPYLGPLLSLHTTDIEDLQKVYELPPASVADIRVNEESNRLAIPIYGPNGRVRGLELRRPYRGMRRLEISSAHFRWPKADTYMELGEPVQSYYAGDYRTTVIVEDQLSARKLQLVGYKAWSLLGRPTDYGHIAYDRIAEIQRLRPYETVIALDADATDAAFMFARTWGHAFERMRVVILERDLKDTPLRDIPAIIGGYT